MPTTTDKTRPEDPREQYPKPPFEEAQQEQQPGLEGALREKPDHGENTYRGSGKLEGKSALITGGDGGIGRAIAIAFSREGANVRYDRP